MKQTHKVKSISQAMDLTERKLAGCLLKYPKIGLSRRHEIDPELFNDEIAASMVGLALDSMLQDKRQTETMTLIKVIDKLGIDLSPDEVHDIYLRDADVKEFDELLNIFLEERKRDFLLSIIDDARIDLEGGAPASEVMSIVSQAAEKVLKEGQRPSSNSIKDVSDLAIDEIEKAILSKGTSGIDTGIKALNQMTGGWHTTDQIVIGARPGMGKTTLANNFLLSAAESGTPAVMFSLEMSKTQIVKNLYAIKTGINTGEMRNGNLTDEEQERIFEAHKQIKGLPLIIDADAFDLNQIKQQARFYKLKHGIRLVIIDYLQLVCLARIDKRLSTQQVDRMISNPSNRNELFETVSRELKMLARELDCTMILLSQLNRSVDTRADRRPHLSDLRSSGAIEQDADMVVMLYRENYYSPENPDNLTELIIRKDRHGGNICTIECEVQNKRKFASVEGMEEPVF